MARPDPHGEDSGWSKGYAWGAAAWIVMIQFIGSRPGDQLPPMPPIGGIDKLGHSGMYGVAGFLLYRATMPWDPSRPMGMDRPALFAIAMASALGLAEEINQMSIPKRSGDPVDWVADTLGAAVLVGLAAWWNARRERSHYLVPAAES